MVGCRQEPGLVVEVTPVELVPGLEVALYPVAQGLAPVAEVEQVPSPAELVEAVRAELAQPGLQASGCWMACRGSEQVAGCRASTIYRHPRSL